jgi:hypothetical protein
MDFFIVPLIFGLIVAVAVVAASSSRRYEANWKAAADRLQLAFQPGRLFSRPKIAGSAHGLTITVDVSSSSSGSSSSVRTRYRVRYPSIGFELRMSRQTGFGKAAEMLGMGDVKIGDQEFDEEFTVRTSDPQQLSVRLTPDTRRVLLDLIKDYRSVKITDELVSYEKNGVDRDTATVVATTRRLIEAARAVQGDDVKPRRSEVSQPVREPLPPPPPVLRSDPFEAQQIELPPEPLEPSSPKPTTTPPPEPLVEQPDDVPVLSEVTAETIAADLFAKKGLSFQVTQKFEERYNGAQIAWQGEVREVITGIGPNDPSRVTLGIATVRHELFGDVEVEAVVSVAGRTPGSITPGRKVSVQGTLSGIDSMSRRLFVDDGTLI